MIGQPNGPCGEINSTPRLTSEGGTGRALYPGEHSDDDYRKEGWMDGWMMNVWMMDGWMVDVWMYG